jgi:hypothetical protein
MTIGPGKYDDEATMVQKATNASGVIVIVIGGDKGEGFACQATLGVTHALPQMLRSIADQIEADFTGTPQ